MKVFVFGGNEGAGEHVLKKLAAKGHEAVTIAETENRAEELEILGAADVIISKDGHFTNAIDGSEAIIYMAGSSLGAGEDQETLVDYGTVRKSLEEAQRHKIERLVYLSPVRTDESPESKETGEKDEPEEWIKKSQLAYTVIRTTKRVSKPGKEMITAKETIADSNGEIPYEDVAAVLVEALDNQNTFRKAFEITAGDTSIEEALDSL